MSCEVIDPALRQAMERMPRAERLLLAHRLERHPPVLEEPLRSRLLQALRPDLRVMRPGRWPSVCRLAFQGLAFALHDGERPLTGLVRRQALAPLWSLVMDGHAEAVAGLEAEVQAVLDDGVKLRPGPGALPAELQSLSRRAGALVVRALVRDWSRVPLPYREEISQAYDILAAGDGYRDWTGDVLAMLDWLEAPGGKDADVIQSLRHGAVHGPGLVVSLLMAAGSRMKVPALLLVAAEQAFSALSRPMRIDLGPVLRLAVERHERLAGAAVAAAALAGWSAAAAPVFAGYLQSRRALQQCALLASRRTLATTVAGADWQVASAFDLALPCVARQIAAALSHPPPTAERPTLIAQLQALLTIVADDRDAPFRAASSAALSLLRRELEAQTVAVLRAARSRAAAPELADRLGFLRECTLVLLHPADAAPLVARLDAAAAA